MNSQANEIAEKDEVSFATLAAGIQRLNELRILQHDLQRKLGDKTKKEELVKTHGNASYNKWRQNRVRELDAIVPELQAVKAWCQRKRHQDNVVSAENIGVGISDATDPVQIIAALQGVILCLFREKGLKVSSAPDNVKLAMRVADGFRSMPDQRTVPWNEHISALLEASKRREHELVRAKESEEQRVKAIYQTIERERERWEELIEHYKGSARTRVTIKEPPDYTSLKDQIRSLRAHLSRLQSALNTLRSAEQVVTEKQLQAQGVLSKILVTPELQDLLTEV